MVDIALIAKGTATLLSPFMPYLVPLGKSVQKKLEDVIAEKGGGAVWQQAQGLWNKVTGRFKDDPVVTAAATMVADDPEDAEQQKNFAKVLAKRLQDDPALAQDLLYVLGGSAGLQAVIGGDEAQISDIHQAMTRPGEQRVEGGRGAVISGVDQTQG
ncbi:hypothetical protein [Leptolyngbya sp. FACHB-261]|uniref:hypothetical protein n=1 Tax=Leptolyngbya sp. FACHB-261 TaxID=2692806 RepID=UPI00168677D9|nr:hypothetical protein [Leptolyngbya sp. FACHB-261]MBD2101787.1 hypothetical protein [Leptolyngbya sp. FACHB-261]